MYQTNNLIFLYIFPAATRSVQEPEDDVYDAAPAVRPSRTFRRGGN